jgi:cell division protein FtsQ
MTSDFSYIACDTREYQSGKTKSKVTKNVEKGLKRILIIAAVIMAAELIWLFVISPFIPFSTVDVQSFAGFERADILRLAGIEETSSYMSTNVKDAQQKLSTNILVESATVIKRFPDKLSIFLVPRKAVALTLGVSGSKQTPLCVDRHGMFFKTAQASSSETAALPIISGIEAPQVNMRLPASLVPLVESISVIGDNSPELLAAVSEIRIERKTLDGFELVLYPVHSSIKVRVENNLTEDVLRFMLLMLNVFETSQTKPEEIDFRSGMGSYKIKEQS